MNKLIGLVAVCAVLLFGVAANAAEIKGIIKSTTDRTITLDTKSVLPTGPAGVDAALMTFTIPAPAAGQTDMRSGLVPGMTVTVTFTTAGTVNTVTKIVK